VVNNKALLVAVALCFPLFVAGGNTGASPSMTTRVSVASDEAKANASETEATDPRYVIVHLRTPEAPGVAALDRVDGAVQVRTVQERVLSSLTPPDFEVTYRYQLLPALAGTVSPEGARILEHHPDVLSIERNRPLQAGLSNSVPLIHANNVHALGYTGEGAVVAVIDTGVDTDNVDLADSLIHQECFMAGPLLASRCPNGSSYQVGPGAAEDDHGHGTNVAGIITSNGTTTPVAVAPGAQVEAFKIIDKNGMAAESDLIAVLDHILAAHPEIDVVNMSLGSFSEYSPGSCESVALPYNQLRSNAILPFAAAMNRGIKNAMAYPACVGSVISVGAVYSYSFGSFGGSPYPCWDWTAADKVACWSNSDPSLDLLAPGCSIGSTGMNQFISVMCGTSQATPHAAAVAALVAGATSTITPNQIERVLESTGVVLTDPANGVTTPRVDALAAFDFDTDGILNPNDPDDDNDDLPDVREIACGSDPLNAASLPERTDTPGDDDGDAQVNEALPPEAESYDCDGDGFIGSAEAAITTNDQDPCGASGWPADLTGDNKLNIADFTSFVFPLRPDSSFNYFNHTVPDPSIVGEERWNLDIASGAGLINIADLNALNPAVNAPTSRPPMFGGQPAFFTNLGQCPWAP